MQSLYKQLTISNRKKRQLSTESLPNRFQSIVSLFNLHNESQNYYSFQYNSSLENLTLIELILPVSHLTNVSTIEIKSNDFQFQIQRPFNFKRNLVKIDLTKFIRKFPMEFSIEFTNLTLKSSGFLTLYFRQISKRIRRDISLINSDDELITYPDNPTSCQVRSYQTSFVDLNLTSWIVEPSSFEMNICSGKCQTTSPMSSYLTMLNLLHRISPKEIPGLCCKPKRFASTILLYYEEQNLVLKRFENMRVIECGCS